MLIGRDSPDLLFDYAQAVTLVHPSFIARTVPGDADDDHVIAAAVSAGAHIIASGDHHLLAMRTHYKTAILTPADTLASINTIPSRPDSGI